MPLGRSSVHETRYVMKDETKIDPKHSGTRLVLRTFGPILVGIGLLLIVIGVGSFFSSFGGFEPPRYFWCAFLGMPLFALGVGMCQYGYFGAFMRYISGEAAPVAKDVFNYTAEGTREGVKNIASAIGEGLRAGMKPTANQVIHCSRCNQGNDTDARFCKNCGTPLGK
jgi:hypothetical protein